MQSMRVNEVDVPTMQSVTADDFATDVILEPYMDEPTIGSQEYDEAHLSVTQYS
jgi:hypothetical protein